MTCKQLRLQQLENLKDGIPAVTYRVEILNSGFMPKEQHDYPSREEAEAACVLLIKNGHKPAFLRKYAVVPF